MTMTNLHKARQAMIEKRAAGELVYLNPMQKAARHPDSLRMAINAKCWECVGGINAPHEVAHCTAWGCPLWPVRPYRNKTQESYGEKERAEVVARIEATISAPESDDPDGASLNPAFESI